MSMFVIPAGFHFRPTDEELVDGYLKLKVTGQPLPSGYVIERDLYSAAPWDVFNVGDPWEITVTENGSTRKTKTEHTVHAFTRLKRASKSRISRIAGCGTWNAQTGATEVRNNKREVIGFKKMLVFEIKKGEKVDDRFNKGHWIMYEYSLVGQPQDDGYVLCLIKRDDSKSLKRARNGVVDDDRSWEE